ncbi:MAG: hypothetical protein ACYTHJ_03235 [Planctomycetota bacterium]
MKCHRDICQWDVRPDNRDEGPASRDESDVDEPGCACDQRDSDADGIDDCQDCCPDSPIDEEVV